MNGIQYLLSRHADLQTLHGSKLWTSVKVHDVLIPASSLLSRLHVFGNNLIYFTNDLVYEVQLIGSATGIKYRDRAFIVCTDHQIQHVSMENVGILYLENQSYVSSAGYSRYNKRENLEDGDGQDICLFDYTEQINMHPNLAQRFFKLNSNNVLQKEDVAVGFLAYGCPFVDQNYDILENNRVDTIIRSIPCEPSERPFDLSLGSCKTLQHMNFDPNGLSGGPVFAMVLIGLDIILKFAGIINRAGGGTIYFINADLVQKMLDTSIDNKK